MGILAGSNIGPKDREDYINILKLNIIIIGAKMWGDDNPSNFNNNKDYKKIKISKPNKYYGE